jgi:hypothetical protein
MKIFQIWSVGNQPSGPRQNCKQSNPWQPISLAAAGTKSLSRLDETAVQQKATIGARLVE